MSADVGNFVLPGDIIRDPNVFNGLTLTGPGLHAHEEPNCLLVTRAGTLSFKQPNIYWVEVCVDSYFKAGKLGPLSSDGFVMTLSLNFINRLLDVACPLLNTLGKKYVFEIAVGMNGKVWINSNSVKDTLSLMIALLAAEHESLENITRLCRQYMV
ncbi:hypothetical protein FQR65_LT15443 [Abscondita terminalis]|nr:hypothetical protein FQR65_LT15443 [Abscondita terminalis]